MTVCQCPNSHFTSSQYSGDEGSPVDKKWRANVRNCLFVTVTILLQQGYFAPKIPGSFVNKFRQISLAQSFIGLFSIWSESSCPSNLPLHWRWWSLWPLHHKLPRTFFNILGHISVGNLCFLLVLSESYCPSNLPLHCRWWSLWPLHWPPSRWCSPPQATSPI